MKPVSAVAFLRSMGRANVRPAVTLVPPPPARLADPTGDVLTKALFAAKLWQDRTQMDLTRDGRRLTVRLFCPGNLQGERDAERADAEAVKEAATATLRQQGFNVRFRDVLACERGRKGWVVLIKAEERV